MPKPGLPMKYVFASSRLMSSMATLSQRFVYETPTRASLKSSASAPRMISSEDGGCSAGSMAVLPPPVTIHFWLGDDGSLSATLLASSKQLPSRPNCFGSSGLQTAAGRPDRSCGSDDDARSAMSSGTDS